MRILNIICDMSDGTSFLKAAERVRDECRELDARQYRTSDMDSSEKTFSEAVSMLDGCLMVIVRVHAGLTYFKKYGRLRDAISERGIPLLIFSEMREEMDDGRHLFPGTDGEYRTALSYVEIGGDENERNLIRWILRNRGGAEIAVGEPRMYSAQGLYLPGKGEVDAIDPCGLPSAAVMFGQSDLIAGRTGHVDALVDELGKRGMSAIPVFFNSNPNEVTGSIGVSGTVRRYLMSNGASKVDAVILTVPFSQLCMSDTVNGKSIFEELGVPVIQATVMLSDRRSWEGSTSGLSPFELSMSIYWPEYDGQIIGVPIASTERDAAGNQRPEPIRDRISATADLAASWSRLRRKPAGERRVAVMLYQNPPRTDMIGSAYGLDAAESTVRLMRLLRRKGYDTGDFPSSGKGLAERLVGGVSNDTEWLSVDDMRRKAVAKIPLSQYSSWLSGLDARQSDRMAEDWGAPPGTIGTVDDDIAIPGFVEGNFFVGIQPDRGMADDGVDIYHSQDITPPHSYLAFYRWVTEVFRADAVIHMGCHGTLEWLPGKGTGLSSGCFPDIVMGHVPHIYPYIMNNPGEGMHAKRRNSAVVIDHLIPTMMASGGYDGIIDIESRIQEYLRAKAGGLGEKMDRLSAEIFALCERTSILTDIWPEGCSIGGIEGRMDRLYDYIAEIKGNMIKNGLHILGRVPEGERLDQTLYSLTNIRNGDVPSLPASVAEGMGYDYRKLKDSPSAFDAASGRMHGEIIDEVEKRSMALLRKMRKMGYDIDESLALAEGSEDLRKAIAAICGRYVPDIEGTGCELENIANALDGRFVPPGPSGCPSRGNAHLLPTGRNFYSIDPASIPTESSWATGSSMAEQMVRRHVDENGCYPKQVGIVIWATDTMKTGGDDIAYILRLLGLRPRWSSVGGSVAGLDVMSVRELGRPRIDVTLRISGLFRDSFPNLVLMIDDAVRTISELDESDEDNYLLQHLRADISESIANGIDPAIARRRASVRIFGDPPGNYGAGVDCLIGSSSWESRKDLADAYVEWGGYAYGRGFDGEDLKDYFRKRMSEVSVTVKNHESREVDAFDNDDDYVFLGGMNAAVEVCGGSKPMSVIGDSSDPSRPKLRTVAEEGKFIYRSRVLSPRWLQGLKEHGYRGVQELSNLVDFSFGWDSTSDAMEDWMYQSVADRFVLDEDNRRWIEENNPDALRHITSRLLEAVERKMWDADEATVKALEDIFVSNESQLEGRGDR